MGKLLHHSRLVRLQVERPFNLTYCQLETNIKLFVAALATVNASVVCPTGWSAGTDTTTADDCSPDDVTVTCNSDSMTVKFPVDAVYYEGSTELDADQLLAAMADVVGQTDTDCIDFAYEATDAGYFTITHDLTACGTDAIHENGNLIFSNTYTGDEAALTVDGVSVSMGTNLAEEVTGTGEYEFTMTTYDADDVEIDANNAAEIGEAITLKVTPNASLPSNVEFQLIDCTAVSEFDTDGITPVANALTYNILEEGSCVSDLLDAQFTTGRSATEVGLTFNSFTFEAADDELSLKCNVKLCLTTDTDCNKAAQKMTAANLDSNDADYFVCDAKYTRSTWWSSL